MKLYHKPEFCVAIIMNCVYLIAGTFCCHCKYRTQQKVKEELGKVLKNGLSKVCGRQPLKNLKGYNLLFHILVSLFSFILICHICWLALVTYGLRKTAKRGRSLI